MSKIANDKAQDFGLATACVRSTNWKCLAWNWGHSYAQDLSKYEEEVEDCEPLMEFAVSGVKTTPGRFWGEPCPVYN